MTTHKTTNLRSLTFAKGIILLMLFCLHACVVSNKLDLDPNVRSEYKIFESGGIEKELNTKSLDAETLIKTAQKYMGIKHCMGGNTTKCLDCSGLIYLVFKDNDVYIPHQSEEQARYGKIIWDNNNLKSGDLVFFINSYKTSKFITHVGIYLGNNEFIHTSSKKGVSVTTIINNSYWEDKFIFGTRVF